MLSLEQILDKYSITEKNVANQVDYTNYAKVSFDQAMWESEQLNLRMKQHVEESLELGRSDHENIVEKEEAAGVRALCPQYH